MIYSDYTRKGIKHRTSHVIIRLSKRKKKEIDLTQQQLAEKSGVGLQFIRDPEQGRITLSYKKLKFENLWLNAR
jgi:hypothetical protein